MRTRVALEVTTGVAATRRRRPGSRRRGSGDVYRPDFRSAQNGIGAAIICSVAVPGWRSFQVESLADPGLMSTTGGRSSVLPKGSAEASTRSFAMSWSQLLEPPGAMYLRGRRVISWRSYAETGRGGAAATTWIFRGDGSRRRRGRAADVRRRRPRHSARPRVPEVRVFNTEFLRGPVQADEQVREAERRVAAFEFGQYGRADLLRQHAAERVGHAGAGDHAAPRFDSDALARDAHAFVALQQNLVDSRADENVRPGVVYLLDLRANPWGVETRAVRVAQICCTGD